MIKRALAAGLSMLLMQLGEAPPAGAVTMEEESLFAEIPNVVTASLKRQSLDKVPGTMTVITAKQIEAMGLTTLIRALLAVPGFVLHQSAYGPEGLFVRGYKFGVAHIRVMLDGHKVNQVYGEEMDAWWDMPLDDVAQIEVIRGPGSSLYGADALMAVVNVITKKEKLARASLSGGGFGHAGVSAAYNSDPERTFRLRTGASRRAEGGPRLRYETDFLNPASAARPSIAPVTKARRSERFEAGAALGAGGFEVEARRVEQAKDWTDGLVNVHSSGRQEVSIRLTHLVARFRHALSERTAVSASASGTDECHIYMGQLMDANPAFPQGAYYDTRYCSRAFGGQSMVESTFGRNSLLLGADYGRLEHPRMTSTRNFHNNFFAAGGVPTFHVSGDDPQNASAAQGHHRVNWGAFAQGILDARPVTLIVGARLDQYQVAGTSYSPRVAAIWELPSGRTVKASFGQAFTAPYSAIRYSRAVGFVGNPGLTPQIVRTYELSFQNSYVQSFHYTATAFSSRLSNAFTFTPNSLGQPAYFNNAKYRFTGVELEGRWDASSRLSVWGHYALAKGKDAVAASPRFGPEWNALAGATVSPAPGLTASVYGLYVPRHARYRNTPPIHSGRVPGYASVNAAVTCRLTPALSLAVMGSNVLDREIFLYNDQGSFNPAVAAGGNDYPTEGRRIETKATYKFGER